MECVTNGRREGDCASGGTTFAELGNAKACRQLAQSQTTRIRQEFNAEDAILLCRVIFRWPAAIVR